MSYYLITYEQNGSDDYFVNITDLTIWDSWLYTNNTSCHYQTLNPSIHELLSFWLRKRDNTLFTRSKVPVAPGRFSKGISCWMPLENFSASGTLWPESITGVPSDKLKEPPVLGVLRWCELSGVLNNGVVFGCSCLLVLVWGVAGGVSFCCGSWIGVGSRVGAIDSSS